MFAFYLQKKKFATKQHARSHQQQPATSRVTKARDGTIFSCARLGPVLVYKCPVFTKPTVVHGEVRGLHPHSLTHRSSCSSCQLHTWQAPCTGVPCYTPHFHRAFSRLRPDAQSHCVPAASGIQACSPGTKGCTTQPRRLVGACVGTVHDAHTKTKSPDDVSQNTAP